MNREPNALDALARVASDLAEYGSYAIIAICLFYFWIGTPA